MEEQEGRWSNVEGRQEGSGPTARAPRIEPPSALASLGGYAARRLERRFEG